MGGPQTTRHPTRDASSARTVGRQQGHRVAKGPGYPRKLRAAVSGKPKRAAKVFHASDTRIFGVYYNDRLVGIVGGENIDLRAGKLEMKKLVGESGLQGKGIGKRAMFGFLYYAFMIRNLNKVYIHSRDINMRNIDLNSRFGFGLEGIFLDDITVGDKHQDVLRMALFKSLWLQIFR